MKQHEEALARGNVVRIARAKLKREIKTGEVFCSEVLRDPEVPDWLEQMPIEELMDSIPRFPIKILHRMLHEKEVKLTARVGELTYRKRNALGKALEAWEVKREKTKPRSATPRHLKRSRDGIRYGMKAEPIA